MTSKVKVAIVISHPIQHFCPQYVSMSKFSGAEVKVFFASTVGLNSYHDKNFGREVSWGNLQLERFQHEFLNDNRAIPADKNIDAPGLENSLKLYSPEVVIIYGYFQKLQRRAYRWAIKNKVRVAYISDSERNGSGNKIMEFVKWPYLYSFFNRISWFLTVGNANEAYYRFYGVKDSKFIRMHFPIDIDSYKFAFETRDHLRRLTREKYGIGDVDITLSVVGKLVPWKNQGDIIDAAILLEGEGLFINLFILGSGIMLEAWKEKSLQLKKGRVIFTGFVSPEELPAFYAASDIYVHPARKEPHSLAISEAIFMGCPVILSDKCGSYGESDDVQAGKNGFVFKNGDIRQLAELIKKIALNREIKMAFGSYSHETAVKFQNESHFGLIEKIAYKVSHESKN